jgi:hypothetical protein
MEYKDAIANNIYYPYIIRSGLLQTNVPRKWKEGSLPFATRDERTKQFMYIYHPVCFTKHVSIEQKHPVYFGYDYCFCIDLVANILKKI